MKYCVSLFRVEEVDRREQRAVRALGQLVALRRLIVLTYCDQLGLLSWR